MNKNNLLEYYWLKVHQLHTWAQDRISGLFLFNIILGTLLLLHSAGYFAPFFLLTINLIAIISLLISVILLRVNSQVIFSIAILFWVFTALLKIFQLDIWAERSAIYAFESLAVGVGLLIIENFNNIKNDN